MGHLPKQAIEVIAPSRLHFGLLSFGNNSPRQFGGAGVMIDQPFTMLRITLSDRFEAAGALQHRVVDYSNRWAQFYGVTKPECRIEVMSVPPQHVGLGVGTQLGLAVAAGLAAFVAMPMPSPTELAMGVGRGLRSAVGTYGFAEGGFVVEGGKRLREPISPLDCRLEIPGEWRFVLICPQFEEGLSGSSEEGAFGSLPDVPVEITNRLQQELRASMVPAIARGNFDEFSESVYRYGRLSGSCFAKQQGGAYNGPVLTDIVETVRSLGTHGVGQSSWGPTIYSIARNQSDAKKLVATNP